MEPASAISGAPIIALWGWRGASISFGIPAVVIANAILTMIRETGSDRAAATTSGTSRTVYRQLRPYPDHHFV